MNKPQYLAELSQLLIFMTRADREETLSRFEALFDKAGPDGEEVLLSKIGSPTRQAIRLSRTYDPANFTDELLDSLEAEPVPEPEPEDEPEQPPEPEEAHLPPDDLPEYGMDDLPDLAGLPDAAEPPAEEPEPAPQPPRNGPAEQPRFVPLVLDDAQAPEDEPEPAAHDDISWLNDEPGEEPGPGGKAPETKPTPAAPAPAPVPAAAGPDEDEEDVEEEDEDEEGSFYAGPPILIERMVPLGVGIPLLILSLPVLMLPLAAIVLALIPVVLLPGLAVLLGAWLAFVGGLWCISYIADAAMLFGLALILLAAGLAVLWLGLWLAVLMVSGYIHALRGLVHLTLGRRVNEDA